MNPLYEAHIELEDLQKFAAGKADETLQNRVLAHTGECEGCFEALLLLMELEAAVQIWQAEKPAPHAAPANSVWASLRDQAGMLAAFTSQLPDLLTGTSFHDAPGLANRHSEEFSEFYVRSGEGAGIHSTEGEGMHPFSSQTASATPPFVEPEKVYGQPASTAKSSYIYQQYPDTCAVQCQRIILNEFEKPITEDQLVREAIAKHLYAPGRGTSPEDVGKLLEAHGVPIHRYENANEFNLAVELAQGHKVIVGVRSEELWHQHPVRDDIADRLNIGGADHAVIVSGIDTTDPRNIKVIITDPGTGDVAKSYPITEFLDAWSGSNFFMVATADPVPPGAKEMINFDYNAGHLPLIGEAPFSFVQELGEALSHGAASPLIGQMENVLHFALQGEHSIADWWHHVEGQDHHHWAWSDFVHSLVDFSHEITSTGTMVSILEPLAAWLPEHQDGGDAAGGMRDDGHGHHDF